MKKIFVIICLSTLSNLVFSQGKLEIYGNTTGLKDGTELTIYRDQPKFIEPSSKKIKVTINNGHFSFSTNQDGAELYYFELFKKRTYFFCDTGKFEMKIPNGSIVDAVLSNNTVGKDYNDFLNGRDSVSRKEYSKALYAYDDFFLHKSIDTIARAEILAKISVTKEKYQQSTVDDGLRWISKKPQSLINTYVLHQLLDIIPDNQLTSIYNKLANNVRSNSWGKDLKYKIDSLFVGGTAPDFEQTDTSNNVINLSSFKGKYVLIDFWATWCIPCRLEIPKLVKAKKLLASDNFEIISFSLDDKSSRQKWLDAIKNEKMDWVNLSTLDGFSNVVARKYHIKSIPSSFLIDPNGKNLATNISGEILYKTLKKLVSVR
ncbi:thiol-disulfide isomerase/thioredoxin [Pedobacter sp. UYP24]